MKEYMSSKFKTKKISTTDGTIPVHKLKDTGRSNIDSNDDSDDTVARLQREYNEQIKELQERQKEIEAKYEQMSKEEQQKVEKPVIKHYDDPLT